MTMAPKTTMTINAAGNINSTVPRSPEVEPLRLLLSTDASRDFVADAGFVAAVLGSSAFVGVDIVGADVGGLFSIGRLLRGDLDRGPRPP